MSWKTKILKNPTAESFSILMGLNIGAQVLCNTYSKAVVTQIEQRYGLSSTLTGSLVASKTVGGIVCLVFLSLFSQNIKNRPKTIAIASCISIIGALIAPIPHFISGKYEPGITSNRLDLGNSQNITGNSGNSSIVGDVQNICVKEDINYCDEENESDVAYDYSSKSIVYFFFISEFMYGIGSSPILPLAMPYLDDNSPPEKTAKHISVLLSLPALGWMLSYVSAGWISNIYVDWPISPEEGLTPADDRWVGAWWMGYFLFSIILLIATIPIFLFPAELPMEYAESSDPEESDAEKTDEEIEKEKFKKESDFVRKIEKEEDAKYMEEFRSMPIMGRIKKIAGNKLMVVYMVGSLINVYAAMAYLYATKYLERQFDLTVNEATTMAVIGGPFHLVGVLLGGYFFSNILRLNAHTAKKPVIFVLWAVIILGTFRLFVGCDQIDFKGYISETEDFLWNDDCHCKQGKLDPVCDEFEPSKGYVTACHAQCLDYKVLEVRGMENNMTSFKNSTIYNNCFENSSVSADFCESDVCESRQLWIYVIGSLLVGFPMSFFTAPFMMIFLGTSPSSEKSVALAVYKLVQKLGGTLWAGTVIGSVFEKSCVLFAKDDCDNQGGCLLYDNHKLRFTYFGYITVVSMIGLSVWSLMLCVKPVKGSTMYREMEKDKVDKHLHNKFWYTKAVVRENLKSSNL